MTNKDLVLNSIDHCKRFQPIAERFNIEPKAVIKILEEQDD